MIIISDTTPLRYLIEIEAEHILATLYGRIIIPQAVFNELQGQKTPLRVVQWIQSPPSWLEVRQADLAIFSPQKLLHLGEREAIALALELKADAFLLDDGDAIKEARRVNLLTLRLFNILESAAEDRLLDLPEIIKKLEETTFHLPPPEIVEEMLERNRQRN